MAGYTREWLGRLEGLDDQVPASVFLELQKVERELKFAQSQIAAEESTDGSPDALRDFAWRLKGAVGDLTPEHIAQRVKVPADKVALWFDGLKRPRSRELRDLAGVLNVNYEWLARGEGERSGPSSPDDVHAEKIVQVREVPVISWTHAGEAATYEEMPRHWQGKVPTASRDRHAFAVIVEGHCMEPLISPGDKVVVEPSTEPRNGKPVVVRLDDGAVHVRIFSKLPNNRVRLTSMKPDSYPALEHDLSEIAWIYHVKELVRTL